MGQVIPKKPCSITSETYKVSLVDAIPGMSTSPSAEFISPSKRINSLETCEDTCLIRQVKQGKYYPGSFYKTSEILDSPIYVFLSGFYEREKRHLFYNFNYDIIFIVAEYAKNWKVVEYTGNPNEHGIIHWISSNNERGSYMNPIESNFVRITNAHDYHVNYSRYETLVSRVLSYPPLSEKDCYFDPGVVCFHFPYHRIHPTGYSFRNGGGRGSVVRKWILEGSNSEEGPWVMLSNHDNDDTFFNDVSDGNSKEKSFLPHCWDISISKSNDTFFCYFRVSSLHAHPTGRPHALYISGFELFGILKDNRSISCHA